MANPIDLVVRTYVAPLMREAGFTKKGRAFYRLSEMGDAVSLHIRPMPGESGFFVTYGFVSRLSQAFHRSRGDSEVAAMLSEGQGLFSRRLVPLSQRSGYQDGFDKLWTYDPLDPASMERRGAELSGQLSAEVIPLLISVLPREGLISFLESVESDRIRWMAMTPEVAREEFRFDQLPPADALREVEDTIARDGIDVYTNWARKHFTAIVENQPAP